MPGTMKSEESGLQVPAWVSSPITKDGQTKYTQGMLLLASAYSKKLDLLIYDAYLAAVRDATYDDFASAIQVILTQDDFFPTVRRLREVIRQEGLRSLLDARRDEHYPTRQPDRTNARARTIAALGLRHEDELWWQITTKELGLPEGIQEGLFVPPNHDRTGFVMVSRTAVLLQWGSSQYARAKKNLQARIDERFGISRLFLQVLVEPELVSRNPEPIRAGGLVAPGAVPALPSGADVARPAPTNDALGTGDDQPSFFESLGVPVPPRKEN